MEHSNIQAAVEAVLFASGEPVESEKLCEAVGIVKDQLEEALGSLADKYSKAESGITLLSLNGSYQLATKEELATFIKAALEIKKNSVLSPGNGGADNSCIQSACNKGLCGACQGS